MGGGDNVDWGGRGEGGGIAMSMTRECCGSPGGSTGEVDGVVGFVLECLDPSQADKATENFAFFSDECD